MGELGAGTSRHSANINRNSFNRSKNWRKVHSFITQLVSVDERLCWFAVTSRREEQLKRRSQQLQYNVLVESLYFLAVFQVF